MTMCGESPGSVATTLCIVTVSVTDSAVQLARAGQPVQEPPPSVADSHRPGIGRSTAS